MSLPGERHMIYVEGSGTVWRKGLLSSQSAFTSSKLTIETLEQGVKYVQS